MELKDVKNISFPKASIEEWKEAAAASLKGRSVEKLKTTTYEGITLNPLYTELSGSANKNTELPGFAPFTRGIAPTGYYQQPWLTVQNVSGATFEEANEKMHAALSRGQNIISYPVQLLAEGASRVNKLFYELPLKDLPVFIDLKGKQKELLPQFKAVANQQSTKWRGVLAEDPIAEWLVRGQVPEDMENYFAEWFKIIQEYQQIGPDLKSILINTAIFHNGGASAVQELGYGLALAVQYVMEGQRQGLSIPDITEKIVFSFAVDSNYFMSIAKLRAARRIWAGLAEAFNIDSDYFKMTIHAVTSELTETLYDQHVNILRTTNQAFAAAIGGIQYLQIHSFDHATGKYNDLSERIARNTHLILKEETNITTVVDPAGGSWYVEQLTDELAEKAWEKFLQIDEAGGIIDAIKQGSLQSDIADVYERRVLNAALRKERIIGTNVYPNPADKINVPTGGRQESFMIVEKSVDIIPITLERISSQFEQLRIRSEEFKQSSGESPKIGLINLKERKSYIPRADFIKGLVAAGGIETVESTGCQTSEEAIGFIASTKLSIYCLCGSDLDYSESVKAIINDMKQQYPHIRLYIAGKQVDELEAEILDAGVEKSIHLKTNVVAFLSELLQELGVN